MKPKGLSLEQTVSWFLVLILGISVLNVLWQVFTRFVLGNPSSYTEELARYLLIWIGLIGGAYASGKGIHLAIKLLPNSSQRWCSIVIELCIVLFAVSVLLVGGIRLVHYTLTLGQTSAALGIRVGYVYLALPISGALITWFAATSLIQILKDPTRR